jgi:hypothetical protein
VLPDSHLADRTGLGLRALLRRQLFEHPLCQYVEKLLADPTPPEWRRDLDPEYLHVIKDLGNAAIHPNEGRIEQQRALDEAVVLQLRALFVELLDDIYEQPEKRSARLDALREARQVFKRRST